jgi:hypothetical protein
MGIPGSSQLAMELVLVVALEWSALLNRLADEGLQALRQMILGQRMSVLGILAICFWISAFLAVYSLKASQVKVLQELRVLRPGQQKTSSMSM